jgi:proline iminopeptidase
MHQNLRQNGTIDREGFKLHYRIEGTGIPSLVIGSALYYPRTFSQNLRNHLQLIFIDHRGFAPSTKEFDVSTYTIDTLIDDIEAIRQHLNIETMIVIGHSGHAYMAQAYAKKYPQHVSHLVLISCGPNQSPTSHAAAEQYFADSVCPERKAYLAEQVKELPEALAADPDRRFITFCRKLGARSWYDYRFDATPLWNDVIVNMPIIDHFWGIVFRDIDITEHIERLTMPVLLALGRYDYLVAPFYTWNPLRDNFVDLTVRLFEQSSHTPQYEQPEQFDHELLAWLARDNNVVL